MNPGVPAASVSSSIPAASGLPFVWTARIFARPRAIRPVDDDLTIEAAGAQERRIEHIRPVGRSDHDHRVLGLEAIHLHEQLVQRLLALVVTATEPGAAVTSNGIDLIDEDDCRGCLLGLIEQVAHTARTDPDEHLDEIGA